MQLAPVGNDVWVGAFEACNESLHRFHRSIHLWHEYQNGQRRCNQVLAAESARQHPIGHVVRYKDGDPFSTIDLEALIAYCRVPGRLLIHCAFGTYRSPTIALLAKAVRGCDPFQGMADVARGMWGHYGNRQVPFFNSIPVREIVERFAAATL